LTGIARSYDRLGERGAPELERSLAGEGAVGVWTKADSVSAQQPGLTQDRKPSIAVHQGEDESHGGGLRWLYFVSPWGMTMELVSYPRGMAYEAGTDDILWRPAET
jgi:hypothetical protein